MHSNVIAFDPSRRRSPAPAVVPPGGYHDNVISLAAWKRAHRAAPLVVAHAEDRRVAVAAVDHAA